MAALLSPMLVLLCGITAHAQGTQGAALFSFERGGETRSVRATTLMLNDQTYTDLRSVAEGLGAGFSLSSSRVQVDLDGESAWVYFHDNRVTASRAEFTLAHPVIQRDGRAWLALRDVPVFFQRAFDLGLTPQAAPAEEPDPLLDFDAQLIDEPALEAPILDETPLEAPLAPDDEADDSVPDPLQEISPDAIRDLRTERGPERIVIDAAHGGDETGVIGQNGLMEKDVTLGLAKALHGALSGRIGREVLLTREDDRPLGTRERAALVTEPGRTLLVSLHCGGALTPDASGVAVFYLPDIVDESMRQLSGADRQQALTRRTANATASRRLAEGVARKLSEQGGVPSRGVRGVASRLLMEADSAGIVVEVGCLTSPRDAERLADSGYQQALASALAEAILSHYGLESPGAAR